MRIVGGSLRGRVLAGPARAQGARSELRPTSDRVREAIFNILAHGIADFDITGVHVLDLFAGTGALGLEALSRGAAFCLFVEDDAEARGLIRENIERLGLGGVSRIFRRKATQLGPSGRHGEAGLVFCDPPYGQGLGEQALAAAHRDGWLAAGAVVVLEERKGVVIDPPRHFDVLDVRGWGSTRVVFMRYL